ncbi:PIN domain-containing protein [Patescibacteria group bacterium]|nr:PIN domain-containing protein [Patescibacteria group bacterium]
MTTSSGSLDANVLLRLLLNDVPGQHLAAAKLIEGSPRPFVVSDIAIVEMVFVLERHYGFTRAQIAEAIEGLASLTEINCHWELLKRALPIFSRFPKLSFEDCCLAVQAELDDALPLWTFDQKLANQAPGVKTVTRPN